MFKKMLLSVLVVFSFTSLIHAQCFQVGLKAEQNLVRRQYNSDIHRYRGFMGLMFNAAVFPIRSIGVEGRTGIIPYIDYYHGLENALFIKYNYEFNYEYLKSVYLTGGYVFHQNTDKNEFFKVSHPNILTMSAAGIGAILFQGLTLEVFYVDGRNAEVGYYDPFLKPSIPEMATHVKVKSVLKLGIGGSFDLFSWKY